MRFRRMMIALLGIGALCAPAFGADVPRPGTLNYVEGTASLEGRQINDRDVGATALQPGQVLTTGEGKAEMLLTPGIFLRMDDHSAVKMVTPDLTPTKVELLRGRAGVEVDQIFPQNVVQIVDGGVITQLIKPGYYEFDAKQPTVLVFKGRAEVFEGGKKWQTVKDHHEMALVADGHVKPANFNVRDAEDELYNWNSLRSEYLAEDNNQIAEEYGGASGFVPGWYWDPYAWDYTYLGWGPFWSPFGWGYYPWGGYWGWGGFYGRGFYGHNFYGNGYHGQGSSGRHYGGNSFAGGGFHGGGMSGGFHGGGFGGGGFHSGGGGRR